MVSRKTVARYIENIRIYQENGTPLLLFSTKFAIMISKRMYFGNNLKKGEVYAQGSY